MEAAYQAVLDGKGLRETERLGSSRNSEEEGEWICWLRL